MYYRSMWNVQETPMSSFQSGDVIAISNRWYTMPTWNQVLYSLLSKVFLKTCWDDVAVVSHSASSTDGPESSPTILYCDFSGAHECRLDDFIRTRRPRGMAVRRLSGYSSTSARQPLALHDSTSSAIVSKLLELQTQPWYLFNASCRLGYEDKYYACSVGMHDLRIKIKNMIQRGHTREAVAVQQKRLDDLEVKRAQLEPFVSATEHGFHLFNGSLVSSFFAAFGLIDRERPSPSRYVPQDFFHSVPFLGTTRLEEPVVFFRL